MFSDNSLKGVLSYFYDHLDDHYSRSEINIFFDWTLQDLFEISKQEKLLNNRRFTESELLQFRDVVDRLAANEPIQYILGIAHFYGHQFKVGPGVLIPRPETEELVDLILKEHSTGSVLDIGTGSGIIPITLKLKREDMKVSGLDISEDALRYARENANTLKVDVHWIQQDILKKPLSEKYDVIVSNPPYVQFSEKNLMRDNVLKHEPESALFVPDEEALKFYERILELSEEAMNPGGWIYFEINEYRAKEMQLLPEPYGFQNIELLNDLQGKPRILKAQKKDH